MERGREITVQSFAATQRFCLPLLQAAPHRCSYRPPRMAREQVALSPAAIDAQRYQVLMDHGFRRSGMIFYRTDCPGCRACVPIRVPVATFQPSRSQRRTLRRNADVELRLGPPIDDHARYDLFSRYQHWKHADGMSGDRDDFVRFLVESPIDTFEMTYWIRGRLVGVGIVDVCPSALSSVYFYFEPTERARGLGTLSALCEIEECRRRGLPYWYAGYYVAGCRKMEYKARFRPYELLSASGEWCPGASGP